MSLPRTRLLALLALVLALGGAANPGGTAFFIREGRNADVVALLGEAWRSPPAPLGRVLGAQVEHTWIRYRFAVAEGEAELRVYHAQGAPGAADVTFAAGAPLATQLLCSRCTTAERAALATVQALIASRYALLATPLWETAPPAKDAADARHRAGRADARTGGDGATPLPPRSPVPAAPVVVLAFVLYVWAAHRLTGRAAAHAAWALLPLTVLLLFARPPHPAAYAQQLSALEVEAPALALCALWWAQGMAALALAAKARRAAVILGGAAIVAAALLAWPGSLGEACAMRLAEVAGDGLLVLPLGLALLGALLVRILRREPRAVTWLLGAIVLFGLVVRLVLAERIHTEAWPLSRIMPIARRIFDGDLLLHLLRPFGLRVFLDDLNFAAGALFGALAPLALFLHARLSLKESGPALLCAFVVAALPLHVRFSLSDTYFVQSMVVGALGFSLVYAYLEEEDDARRFALLAALGVVVSGIFWLRPDNITFFPIFLAAIFVVYRARIPLGRRLVVTAVVCVAAAIDLFGNLLVQYTQNVREGLSMQTVWRAATLLFDTRMNVLINPDVTPFAVMALALLGLATLLARRAFGLALYLIAWLAFFIGVHAYVVPERVAMQARYYMHMVSPLVLLAGCALPALARLPRPLLVAALAVLAASPLLHRAFIEDRAYNHIREFEWVESMRATIPPGCTILDYLGPDDCPSDGVFARVGRRRPQPDLWDVREFTGATVGATGNRHRAQRLDKVLASLEATPKPGRCLLYYEGMRCFSVAGAVPLATECARARRRLRLTEVGSISFPSRYYDAAASKACAQLGGDDQYERARREETVTLRLYRVDDTGRPTGR